MANNPKFNFYVNDFEGGTRYMTDAELGCYIRLLLAQFNRGGVLPNDSAFLSRFCTSFKESWPVVSEKFRELSGGKIQNIRMEIERQKSENFSQSRSENRRKTKRNEEEVNNDMFDTTNTQDKTLVEQVGNGNGIGNKEVKEGIGGTGEKETIRRVSMPYNGTFEPVWQEWKNYKLKQHSFKYKTHGSEQAALHELVSMAPDEQTAIAIINQSMANGWKGLFALKKTEINGHGTNSAGVNGTGTVPANSKIAALKKW